MTGPHVAVVGGGWAGMACAVELARAGVRVSVFEGSGTLGGRARVVEKDGWRIDNGQHILAGAYTETLSLLRFLKVSPKRLDARPFFVHIPGVLDLEAAALPAPLHLGLGLLRAKGLNWADRFATARLMHYLKKRRFALSRDVSVSALLRLTRQTPTLNHLLWEPLCLAALNTPAGRASAQVFANVLRDSVGAGAGASEMLIPRVDLTDLFPVPAARYLAKQGQSVQTMTKIRAVTREEAGFKLDGDPLRQTFSHVVLATAPWQVGALTEDFAELAHLRRNLAAMKHEPITTVYLAYPETIRLPKPMIGLAEGCLQWVFDRGQLGGPAGLLAGVISASEAMSREEVALRAHQDIEGLFEHLPAPHWTQVITEKRATFACEPGILRPITLTPVKKLLLAGDYVASDYPATLEGAVRSGLNAARTILRNEGIRIPPRFSLGD